MPGDVDTSFLNSLINYYILISLLNELNIVGDAIVNGNDQLEIRFRTDKFNRTSLPIGLIYGMSDAEIERFKDASRVLNCIFSGNSLRSFETRVILDGEGDFEGLNAFINSQNWSGLYLLPWPESYKDVVAVDVKVTLAQWIYFVMYKRMAMLVTEQEEFVDWNLRVVVAYICALRKSDVSGMPGLLRQFEKYLDDRSCSDCSLKNLRFKTLPYSWNECDSFSFLSGDSYCLRGVRIDYGKSCSLGERKVSQLGSNMGVRYFGEHSVFYADFQSARGCLQQFANFSASTEKSTV
jgi:hypothetical protein